MEQHGLLHWIIGFSLLVDVFTIPMPVAAQEPEGQVIVVSPRVGEVIDAEERERLKLFPGIPEFRSTAFLRLPAGKIEK